MNDDAAARAADAIADLDRRSVEHVRNAIATVTRVIEENRRLAARFPDHAASAHERILEGEGELATFEVELAALEARIAARDQEQRSA
ncbi:MAG: hypothetical protein ACJ77B_07680 [Chloroflexota bacterium]